MPTTESFILHGLADDKNIKGATYEDLQYGLGEDIEGDYDSAITNLSNHNGASAMYALRLNPIDHDLSSEGHFLPDLSLN